jgi:hypothetical protein
VLRSDIGQKRQVVLSSEVKFEYQLDSRLCLLMLAGRAIGLAFLTYDHKSTMMYGNYIAVQECWRSGGLADAFANKIDEVFTNENLFQHCRGIVFEVEPFCKHKVEAIISELEKTRRRKFANNNDRDEIRKFLRVCWYQSRGFQFFLDCDSAEPIVYKSPCLDPDIPLEQWQSYERDYWLMWRDRRNIVDATGVDQLWRDCVNCVCIEILAKSLAEESPNTGLEYWNYANALVARALKNSPKACLGRFVYRRDDRLWSRWKDLKIHIAI